MATEARCPQYGSVKTINLNSGEYHLLVRALLNDDLAVMRLGLHIAPQALLFGVIGGPVTEEGLKAGELSRSSGEIAYDVVTFEPRTSGSDVYNLSGSLFVDTEYRKQGIGAYLLDARIAQGIPVFLNLLGRMPQAVHCWVSDTSSGQAATKMAQNSLHKYAYMGGSPVPNYRAEMELPDLTRLALEADI